MKFPNTLISTRTTIPRMVIVPSRGNCAPMFSNKSKPLSDIFAAPVPAVWVSRTFWTTSAITEKITTLIPSNIAIAGSWLNAPVICPFLFSFVFIEITTSEDVMYKIEFVVYICMVTK